MHRFEIQLPSRTRHELGALADELGLTAAAVAKIAIQQLLADPARLTGRKLETPAERAA